MSWQCTWHHRSVLKPGRYLQQAIMNIAEARKRPWHGSSLSSFYTCEMAHKKGIFEPVKPKVIIIFVKEVMFSPVSVCWFVSRITQKLPSEFQEFLTDFLRHCEIFLFPLLFNFCFSGNKMDLDDLNLPYLGGCQLCASTVWCRGKRASRLSELKLQLSPEGVTRGDGIIPLTKSAFYPIWSTWMGLWTSSYQGELTTNSSFCRQLRKWLSNQLNLPNLSNINMQLVHN